jgi:hypothetical protein
MSSELSAVQCIKNAVLTVFQECMNHLIIQVTHIQG